MVLKVDEEVKAKWLNFYELFRKDDYLFNDKETYYTMFGKDFNPITLEELEVRNIEDYRTIFYECLKYDRINGIDKKASVKVIDGYMREISGDRAETKDNMNKFFDLCMHNVVSFDYDIFMYLCVIKKYGDDFFQWLEKQDKSQMTFRQVLDILERKINSRMKRDGRDEGKLNEARTNLINMIEKYGFKSNILGASYVVEFYLKTKFPTLWNRYKNCSSSLNDDLCMMFLSSLKDSDIYQYNSNKIRSYLNREYSDLMGIEDFMMLNYPVLLNKKIDELVDSASLDTIMNLFLKAKVQSLDELVNMYFVADKHSSMFSYILEIMQKTGKDFFEILNIDNVKNLQEGVISEKEIFELLKKEIGQVKMVEVSTLAVIDKNNPLKKAVIILKNSGDYVEYSSETNDKEKKCISHPRTILNHYHAPKDYSAIDAHGKSMLVLKKQALERDSMGNFIGDIVITLEGDNSIVWCPPVPSENQIMQLPVLLGKIQKDSYKGIRCSCCLAGNKMWFMVHEGKEYNLNQDDLSEIVSDIMDVSGKVLTLIDGDLNNKKR